MQAKQLWQEAIRIKKEISHENVFEIAKKTGYLEGKWVFHPHKDKLDENWRAVAMGILNKKFGEDILQATVDCKTSVIRVYTKDFTCRDEIFFCEETLRKECVTVGTLMQYRPSIFSLLRINRHVLNQKHFNLYQTSYPAEMDRRKVTKIFHEVTK